MSMPRKRLGFSMGISQTIAVGESCTRRALRGTALVRFVRSPAGRSGEEISGM
jgi:hypothetical protein